jgi:hypothetical protein
MPVDRGSIEEQLRTIGEGERWWDRAELRDLPHVLHPGERIHGICAGRLLARPRLSRKWLVLATSERLLLLRQEQLARRQIDVPFSQITSITHGRRIFSAEVSLHTLERRYRIRIGRRDATKFLGAVSMLVQRLAPLPGVVVMAGLPTAELVARPDLDQLDARVDRIDTTVERLEADLERLQQQVDFLESLLRRRGEAALTLPGS